MKELHNVRANVEYLLEISSPPQPQRSTEKIPSIRFANLNSIDLDFPGLLNYNNTQAGGLPCS